MSNRKQIALDFSIGIPRSGRLIEGVIAYVNSKELEWSFVITPEDPGCSIQDLYEWPGDGVIANLNSSVDCSLAANFRIPLVNISGAVEQSPVPRVMSDSYAIGRLAAKHLMDRGFKRFAFYGLENLAYSRARLRGFEECLATESFECENLLVPATFNMRNLDWGELYDTLGEWLSKLTYPLGLFVVTDYRSRLVLDVCHDLKIPIPRKLAIVSVDNEETLCNHSTPTLTSIDKNDYAMGWHTAEILDNLMSGRETPEGDVLIKPNGVISRHTTDTLSVEDNRLADAIEFIRTNYHKPITVDWVAQHINVSRRWLENAFREHAQVSPYQYLCDYRIIQAKRLLDNNNKISVQQIADMSGFDNAKHFNSVFKRVVGESPTQYRRRKQAAQKSE